MSLYSCFRLGSALTVFTDVTKRMPSAEATSPPAVFTPLKYNPALHFSATIVPASHTYNCVDKQMENCSEGQVTADNRTISMTGIY